MTLPASWPPLPTAPLAAERIAYVTGLMRLGLWRRGESFKHLALAWGLDGSTIRRDSATASNIVRAALDDVDVSGLRAEVVNDLREAKRLARRAAGADPIGAGKLLVAAAGKLSDVTGAAAPRKQEVKVTGSAGLDALLYGAEGEEQ